MILKFLFGFVFLLWSIWWALLHVAIRKNRAYASGRVLVSRDKIYAVVSPFMFVLQTILVVYSIWSNYFWLFKFHDNTVFKLLGFVLFLLGSCLYKWALNHLGKNYSPCYDSHRPVVLVKSGPYSYMRHPMYIAKILIGIATLIVSGSLLFVPLFVYLCFSDYQAIQNEDAELRKLLGEQNGFSCPNIHFDLMHFC